MDLSEQNKWLDQQIEKLGLELKRLESTLFPEQKKFKDDPAKRKTGKCSRRAGKTTVAGVDLLESIYDLVEGDSAYIGLTRGHAKKVMFNQILKFKKKYNLKITENRSELTFTCDKTGNTLYITGANNEEDTEKIRGLKLKKIYLDEVASFRAHINYLIDEVLEPTTIDLDGSIILIGTPSANPLDDNIFYRATTGLELGWSNHFWTLRNNPYIKNADEWLKRYIERKGWDETHPIYLREWCGEWTIDKSSIIFKYDENINHFSILPKEIENWRYVFGVDLGFDDAFAIVVIAFSYDLPNKAFVVDEFKKSGLIPEKMAMHLISYINQYSPIAVMADTGGLGKAIVEEFRVRYKINVEKADKTQKLAFIEIVNGDLISGSLMINKDSQLAKELKTHQWDPEDKTKEDDRTENHLADGLLYGMRKVRHYMGTEKEDLPKEGSKEYLDKEAEKMLADQIKNMMKREEEDGF